jgi:polysaccharide deacetylase 2 family uncharacterized protein YibQ
MKKTVKTTKKTSPRKTIRKRPLAPVSGTARKPGKSKKRASSDAQKAIALVGGLLTVATVISFAIISSLSPSEGTEQAAPAPVPVTEKPAPQATVSVQPKSSPPAAAPAPAAAAPAPAPAVAVRTTAVKTPPAAAVAAKPAASAAAAPPERAAVVEHRGTLVFMIDDAGNNLRELDPFLRIPGPITIAVLPGLPHSAEAARRIRAAGKEVFLHQPMEAIGGQNPGPSAIYSNMSEDEIRAVLKKNVEEIGPIAGMNNHQGSKITMDRQLMEIVLSFCAENGILFLDSRTTADTAAPAAARQIGMKIGERDVFLDNEQSRDSMIQFLNTGLEKARKNGNAVMIGHTWSPELAPLLTEQYAKLTEMGYTIRKASDIIR